MILAQVILSSLYAHELPFGFLSFFVLATLLCGIYKPYFWGAIASCVLIGNFMTTFQLLICLAVPRHLIHKHLRLQ